MATEKQNGTPNSPVLQATAWNDGGMTYGIRVGAANRDRHFDRAWSAIELEIDGQTHVMKLSPGFWKHCPEFRSPVIREWLRSNNTLDWPKGHPPRMQLIHLGANRFRLVA